MKLQKIKIQNFRSILREEVNLQHKCIGLIGLNESGKSNVLGAIRLLEESHKPTLNDRSKISGVFPEITLTLNLSVDEIEEVKQLASAYVQSVIRSQSEVKIDLLNLGEVQFTLKIENNESGEIQKIKTLSTNYDLQIKKEGDFASFADESPLGKTEAKVEDETGELSDFFFGIEKSMVIESLKGDMLPLDVKSISGRLQEEVQDFLISRVPGVVFWTYQPKYLLPVEISYDEFIKDDAPYENSAPLYNAILLSNSLGVRAVADLKKKILLWKQDSSERKKDAKILTDSLNQHVKAIWADYDQEINIGFEESKITVHINDPVSKNMNFYSMEARSQGFKTFISFILTIAAEAESRATQNILLLLDEPETHLHPSGARYMKEELLKLADKGNYVVYATHSIFMIDRRNLERHIIVHKESELTRLTKVESNNFIQEAVLYEAMGAKLDEFSIGLKNIVFEGRIDLALFDFLVNKCLDKTSYKEVQEHRLWNGGGTKRITTFLADKILPLKSRWYLILDSDTPGRQLKKSVEEKYVDENYVITGHFYSETKDFEIEDILPKQYIKKAFDKAITEIGVNDGFMPDFSNDSKLYSATIGEFKARQKLTKELDSIFEMAFKTTYEELILEELALIDKEGSKTAKLDKFKSSFDSYSKFAMEFVKTFKPEDQGL